MESDQPKAVQVVLTEGLAAESLATANADGLSRSAWLRGLIETALRDEAAS